MPHLTGNDKPSTHDSLGNPNVHVPPVRSHGKKGSFYQLPNCHGLHPNVLRHVEKGTHVAR